MRAALFCVALWGFAVAEPLAAAPKDAPSRAAVPGCAWEKLASESVGLAAWVQRCDLGFRKIDLLFDRDSMVLRFSDGGAPQSVIDVFDLLPGESIEAGIGRLYAARTNPAVAARCVLAPNRNGKAPTGARRYTFVPNADYRKELKAKADPEMVPPPPCGDWGDAPDGLQYFEAWPGSKVRRVLFVRVGQDEPLFDERTLRLIGPATK